MSDPDATQPPHVPNTPRNLLEKLMALAVAHPAVTVPAVTFLLGIVVGKIL